VKLTNAQMELLTELGRHSTHVVRYYRPAQKLVELGFAEWSGIDSDRLSITSSGRAMLPTKDGDST
jgi:hypothetical protein